MLTQALTFRSVRDQCDMVNLPSLLGIDDGGRAIAQGECGVRGENRDGFGLGEELV